MPGVTTFLDSCALINAYRGSDQTAAKLISIIEDPDREFITDERATKPFSKVMGLNARRFSDLTRA